MAHFAQLDENNIVTQVLVVSNDDIKDENGDEQEIIGFALLEELTGHDKWMQTSYNNNNFRKNYAGIGFKYDEARDAFIPPQPFPSWVLDEQTCSYVAPVAYPQDGERYLWNEENLAWELP